MKKKYLSKIYNWIRLIEIVAVVFTILITYSKLRDIIHGTTFSLKIISFLIILMGTIYILLVINEFIDSNSLIRQRIGTKNNAKNLKIEKESLKSEFNMDRIILLIYFMIFCFGLFAGIAVFKNSQPLSTIPKFPIGTIGLRSYGCKVTFTKIEISFLDSKNVWQVIPQQVTNDSTNWEHAFLTYTDSSWTPPKEDTKSFFKYSQPNDTLSITLNNSGVKFNITDSAVAKYFKGSQYFKVDTRVIVHSRYADYPDAQICMNVTTESEKLESEELYLGLSLVVNDVYNSKFWIPALESSPGYDYRYPISKLKENDVPESLSCGKEYNFIGVSLFNSVRLLIKNKKGASIICETKYEPSK